MAKKETKKKIERMILLEIKDLDNIPSLNPDEVREIEQQQIRWYKVLEVLEKV